MRPIWVMSLWKEENCTTVTQTEYYEWWRQRLKCCSYKTKNSMDGQSPLEGRKRQGRILPFRFQKECGAADILVSDFQPSELWNNVSVVLSTMFVVICYQSPEKLGQIPYFLGWKWSHSVAPLSRKHFRWVSCSGSIVPAEQRCLSSGKNATTAHFCVNFQHHPWRMYNPWSFIQKNVYICDILMVLDQNPMLTKPQLHPKRETIVSVRHLWVAVLPPAHWKANFHADSFFLLKTVKYYLGLYSESYSSVLFFKKYL